MKAALLTPALAAATLLFSSCGTNSKPLPPFPGTQKAPVIDAYHGITVADDYRWLDDLNDPAVRKWNDAQNAYTRAFLDAVPARAMIVQRLNEIENNQSASYYSLVKCQKLFAMKSQPPKNQPMLVVLDSPDDLASERVVVDPNQLNSNGTTAIDWYVPSKDGRLVAVSLSENGSEDGSAHVFEVNSGAKLSDVVPRVQFPTAGGDLEWTQDGSGFYYTRFPQGDERPPEDANFFQQVYFHKLGTAASADTYVIGREFPRIAEIQLSASDDGKYLLATVANGDGGEFAHYLRNPSGAWTQVTQFADQIPTAQFGENDRLYLLSRAQAPKGTIVAVALAKPLLAAASLVVPEGEAAIYGFHPTATKLYVAENVGGPSQLRVVDLVSHNQQIIPTPPIGSVRRVVRLQGDEIIFGHETFLEPFAWYQYDPATHLIRKTAMFSTATVDFSDCEVIREFATSRDGTKVPMNIIRRKETKLDGRNPTLLYGYGGYNVSLSPSFSAERRVWLDNGGVYVVANLRGGGEYGEEWHQAGNLTRKQNVFDDFAACAQFLIETKYTNPAQLAIEGGSNGGLLMGATLTQHPELFRAVVSHVGIYDMLRVELFPNGAFNVTEFGTVKDPEQFKALYAYSPYHHVTDRTAYPAVLFLTGDHDGRVDPANSRKMTAHLQAATSSGLPILLRTSASAGHGIGTARNEQVAQEADVFAFLVDQLGMQYR